MIESLDEDEGSDVDEPAPLDRVWSAGLEEARRIMAELGATGSEKAKQEQRPALGSDAWCHRCGYPKAGHGTWATCGGWL